MQSVFFSKPLRRQTISGARPESAAGPRWRWWLSVWTPVAIAVCIIAAESTSTFSAQNTSGWLRPAMQHWFGLIDDATWERLHHYFRKTGHFVGYGLVCLSFLRAWLHTLVEAGPKPLLSWRLESCILAVFSTAIIASCDEAHQAMLPDRTGTVWDVLLDTTGALVTCLLIWAICWSTRTTAEELERSTA